MVFRYWYKEKEQQFFFEILPLKYKAVRGNVMIISALITGFGSERLAVRNYGYIRLLVVLALGSMLNYLFYDNKIN